MSISRRGAIALLALAVATGLILLHDGTTQAQVQLIDKEELRSGGAVAPDLSVLTPGPGSRTGKGSPPRVGPNVQANDPQLPFPDGLLGRSETTIASNNGGTHMVAGWNDADGFCGPPFGVPCSPPPVPGLSGYSYSTDGGQTWFDGGAPPVFDGAMTRGDPWLDLGGHGNDTYFYANLAVNATDAGSRGVIVHRGTFAGNTLIWYDGQVFDSPRNAVTPGADFYDKEALVAAKDGSGAAYVSLTNFQETCRIPQFGYGTIEIWRTHDGGDTWEGPAIAGPDQSFVLDPDDPVCGFEGVLQQSSVPAIGSKGEVYVVWQLGPTFTFGGTSTDADIVVARSLDGGETFEPFVKVADINSMRGNSPVGYNRSRLNDHPRITVAQNGKNKGRVYVTFYSALQPVVFSSSGSQVSSQVYLSYSDDKGTTWSTPVPITPAIAPTTVKRFWPVVTLQPGGNIDIVYYESREVEATPEAGDIECTLGGKVATFSSLVDTYWARSLDGGQSFEAPIKLSTATTNWCTTASNIVPNFGDYIGATSGGNRVLATWADGRNGVPDTFYAQGQSAGKAR